MDITSVSQYNSIGAQLLTQYGEDKNGNKEVELSEARGNLSVDEFRRIAAAGDSKSDSISYLDVLIYERNTISQDVRNQIVGVIIPEMIDIPGMTGKSIMKGEVTVGLFKQVMEGYEITGHNADKLQAILNDPSQANKALTYVSLLDAREFAKRLSKLTGRKFRVQAEDEWLAAKGKLSGNYWTWTETKYDDVTFVLRHLFYDIRTYNRPERRYYSTAVRLVEDLE